MVGQRGRDVGLAEDDRSGVTQAANDGRVGRGDVIAAGFHPPRGGEASDVVGLLDRHRQTEKRRSLAVSLPLVDFGGRFECAVEVPHDHGIGRAIASLNSADRGLGRLDRRELAARNGAYLSTDESHTRPIKGRCRIRHEP